MGEVTKSNVMRWGKHITRYLAAVALAIAVVTPLPCAAQKSTAHPCAPAPAPHAPHIRSSARPAQQGHAGDWLRRYKDLPPQEQERALQNDPGFRRLPPARQQLLRQRLQHFSNLPPQRQLQMLNRMETWEHLTPAQSSRLDRYSARCGSFLRNVNEWSPRRFAICGRCLPISASR